MKNWNDEEWKIAVEEIITKIGTRARLNEIEVSTLFQLFNDRVPEYWRNHQYGQSCGRCLKRVWDSLNAKLAQIKKKEEDEAESAEGNS